MKNIESKSDKMIKGTTIYIKNKYGSYTENGDTDMSAQKNAMSHKELIKLGYENK